MRHKYFIYLCNAIDEATCQERGITSDSPAATQKVLQISRALRQSGVSATILSLGRGRQHGTGRFFPASVKRVDGTPVLYGPFLDRPILTHLVTLLGLLPLIIRLRRKRTKPALLVYNRLGFYWPAMEMANWLGFRQYLDLEDGTIAGEGSWFRQCVARFMSLRTDRLCKAGALLAASALKLQFNGVKTMCCYGVANNKAEPVSTLEHGQPLIIHLGGTLQYTTGSHLLAEAIRCLRSRPQPPNVRFIITGMGTGAEELEALSRENGLPQVQFLGKVSRKIYDEILRSAHIGLALKLRSGDLADTTFPSKVIEIASSGMVLLSTRISDVPLLFQEDGAIFINEETPEAMSDLICRLDAERAQLPAIAAQGQRQVNEACSAPRVGSRLKHFFFGDAGA